MRVVLHANVLVSAAIAQGPSYRIVTRWLADGDLEVVVCPALLAEVEDVLGRPRIQKRIDPESSQRYLATIRRIADVAPDPAEIESITRDADDDYLLALAREHRADYIVTGDKDLLEWPEQRPPVLTPAAFAELAGAQEGCRSANGLLMAASGNERQGAASSVSAGRQLPLFAAPCRLLPPAAGSGR